MAKINKFPETYLKDFSIEENVYLLGRIWADGHVSKNSLHLYAKACDMSHLMDYFAKNNVTSIYKRQRYKNGKKFGSESYDVIVGNTDLVNFLLKYDYKDKSIKSPSLILKAISKEFHYLFWRGFFDGDGSLYFKSRNCLNFWGSINQDWSDVEVLLKKLECNYSMIKFERKNGKHKASSIEIRRLDSIKQIMDYIYYNYDLKPIGLKRKYDNYQLFLNTKYKNKKSRKYESPKGIHYNKISNKWGVFIYKPIHKFLGWHTTMEEAYIIQQKYILDNNIINTETRHKYTIIGK